MAVEGDGQPGAEAGRERRGGQVDQEVPAAPGPPRRRTGIPPSVPAVPGLILVAVVPRVEVAVLHVVPRPWPAVAAIALVLAHHPRPRPDQGTSRSVVPPELRALPGLIPGD